MPVKGKKILILGSKGFIGQHIERCFREKNQDLEVVGLGSEEIDMTSERSLCSIDHLFDNMTTVIYLAAIKRQFGDSQDVFERNLQMTLNLCRVIEKKQISQMVFFSSAAVYGEDIQQYYDITENTKVEPTSYYGMAKYISEKLLWKTKDSLKNTSLLILRPPIIYGPGDNGGTYGPVLFTQKALRGETITLWGDGTEFREFMEVSDLAEITRRLILSRAEGIYNLTNRNISSFIEVINILEKIIGKKLLVDARPRTKRKVDNIFSSSKLKGVIGDYHYINLEEGLKMLCEHYLNNPELLYNSVDIKL